MILITSQNQEILIKKPFIFKNLIGKKFGLLTVISLNKKEGRNFYWDCICDCNSKKIKIVNGDSLKTLHTRSCGCLDGEKHNYTYNPIYRVWHAMINRCYNPKNNKFHIYGERGIKVCERWLNSAKCFIEDMGYRPKNTSIDRINNNGNYSCGKCKECLSNLWNLNCRWATRKEQNKNRRNTIFLEWDNKRLTIEEWSNYTGISKKAIITRLKRKWDIERVLTIPTGKYSKNNA